MLRCYQAWLEHDNTKVHFGEAPNQHEARALRDVFRHDVGR